MVQVKMDKIEEEDSAYNAAEHAKVRHRLCRVCSSVFVAKLPPFASPPSVLNHRDDLQAERTGLAPSL